jgi:hypothetical protein
VALISVLLARLNLLILLVKFISQLLVLVLKISDLIHVLLSLFFHFDNSLGKFGYLITEEDIMRDADTLNNRNTIIEVKNFYDEKITKLSQRIIEMEEER